MRLGPATPIVRSFDEQKARAFYIDYLGFELRWEHRFEPGLPLYSEIARDDCVIHLSEHHGDASPGAALRIPTRNLDEYHQALTAKTYAYAKPEIQLMPWGSREMRLTDPFGNRLIFFEFA